MGERERERERGWQCNESKSSVTSCSNCTSLSQQHCSAVLSEHCQAAPTLTPAFYDNFYWGNIKYYSLPAPYFLSGLSHQVCFIITTHTLVITGRRWRRRRWRKGTGASCWRTDCPITPGTGESRARPWPGWALRSLPSHHLRLEKLR